MRVKMIVAYDGTNYKGWQVQPNGITIEEVLNKNLSNLLGEQIVVSGASRTDSGSLFPQKKIFFFQVLKSDMLLPRQWMIRCRNDQCPVLCKWLLDIVGLARQIFHQSQIDLMRF